MFFALQEIALQQIMAHLDSVRKDMVILEKSEFANLRSENMVTQQEFILLNTFNMMIRDQADHRTTGVEP